MSKRSHDTEQQRPLLTRLRAPHTAYYKVPQMRALLNEAADAIEAARPSTVPTSHGSAAVTPSPLSATLPPEPTDEMYEAFFRGWTQLIIKKGTVHSKEYWINGYKAMLAAMDGGAKKP